MDDGINWSDYYSYDAPTDTPAAPADTPAAPAEDTSYSYGGTQAAPDPVYDQYDQIPAPSPYAGYTTGQMADPTSPMYDPNMVGTSFDWEKALGKLGTSAKKALLNSDGSLTDAAQRLLSGALGGGIAGLMAPKNAGQAQMFQAGASPGFVNMSKRLVRTPVANRTGGNYFNTTYAAKGGIMPGQSTASSSGGMGYYLGGPTDGMADKVDATIDGNQPAKLAHGEFIIPADVVSHLGNGNSDAGAQKLYQMMAHIRKARTGNSEQGKEIDPNKFLPGGKHLAEGGIAGYAPGGVVTAPAYGAVGSEQNVSNWAAPYIGDMLSNSAAVANSPYQAYQGPLTAGSSALQTQASQGLQGIATPANYGQSFTNTGIQQQYMNPYLSGVLNPQLDEMRRQSQITQSGNDAKMAQSGGFGGDRQAIMTGETQRNLGQQQDVATGNAYNNAYNTGMQQFNTEQGQAQNLINQKANVGASDQATEQAGITANVNAFNTERDNPMKMLQFQQSMLQGLPITSTGYATPTPTLAQEMAGGALGADSLWQSIFSPKKAA